MITLNTQTKRYGSQVMYYNVLYGILIKKKNNFSCELAARGGKTKELLPNNFKLF
jgi:hypothetical protein